MRTVLSKNKDGLQIKDTLEIGKTIRKADSEFNITEMGINMKVVGRIISALAREPTGYMKEKISSIN